MMIDQSLRDRISTAITEALRPLPIVFAGWEGGSAAFAAVDEYSDIDLAYLVADDASFELLYTSAEHALETVEEWDGVRLPFEPRSFGKGINSVFHATHRQNFLVPPRAHRSFPLSERRS